MSILRVRTCMVLLTLAVLTTTSTELAGAQTSGDGACFVSQSVPSTVTAGQPFSVTVTMANTGGTTWPAGGVIRLGSQNLRDNTTWGNTVQVGTVTTSRIMLASSVAPGQNAVLNFSATAPATPGTYNFQWRMVHEAVAWFGDYTPNVSITVGSGGGGTDGAAFVSQSGIPSTVVPGGTFTATITMLNSGTSTWTAGGVIRLGSQNPRDNTYWGNTVQVGTVSTSRIMLPSTVAPGQNAVITFTATAPATAGTYNFEWQMVHEGVAWFGTCSPNVAITVASGPLPVQSTDWTCVGGNTARTGVSAGGSMDGTLTRTWTTANCGAVSPDPRVIAGSALVADTTGVFFCHAGGGAGSAAKLSASSGSVAWNASGGHDYPLYAPPCILSSALGKDIIVQDDSLYWFDSTSASCPLGQGTYDFWGDLLTDGARLYQANMFHVDGDPACLEVRNPTSGAVLWTKWYDTSQGRCYKCSQFALCLDGNQLFVYLQASASTMQGIWSLDPTTGAENWKQIGTMVIGRPSAANGTLFAAENGALVARKESDGTILWEVPGTFDTCPPVLASGLCISITNGSVCAYSQTAGQLVWSRKCSLPASVTETTIPGSFTKLAAAGASGTLVITETGGITILNLADGSLKASLPTSGYSTINPVIVGKRLYVRRLSSATPTYAEAWDCH